MNPHAPTLQASRTDCVSPLAAAAPKLALALALGLLLAMATFLAIRGASPAAAQAGACPNAQFRKGIASHLPDCRAYEQVSPVFKNGADIGSVAGVGSGGSGAISQPRLFGGPVAADGDVVAFETRGSFADDQTGFGGSHLYFATRSDGAWLTRSLLPRSPGLVSNKIRGLAPDLSESIIQSSAALTPGSSAGFFHRDNLTRSTTFAAASTREVDAAAVSADLAHIAFDTPGVITDLNPPAPDQPTGQFDRKVYEYTGGDTRLVTRQPGTGAAFATAAFLGARRSQQGAISEDGEHIFFTTPQLGDAVKVYRRSYGTTTTLVSPSKRTTSDAEAAKHFQLATPDGNRAFFLSRQRLTNDANTAAPGSGGDLYRYDAAADELLDLSAQTAGDADADVQGVLGASDSGDRVYFAARGEVVPGEGDPAATKLYLWEDDGTAQGTVRFIADLHDDPAVERKDDDSNWLWNASRTAQVTADGDHLLFRSFASITGFDAAGTAQIYLYDAGAAGGTGDLACVSCPGHPPLGNATTPRVNGAFPTDFHRRLSEDGERVFFTSPDALAGRDSNGKLDAYLWQDTSEAGEPLTGETHLVSSGRSGFDSYAFGGSADGDDYFFRTREQLVPSDVDTLIDVYTARVNGGLASQHSDPTPECEGDGCQGEPSSPPEDEEAGSAVFTGPGNSESQPGGEAKRCQRLDDRAGKKQRRAKEAKRKLKRAKRKARRAQGKRAKRLDGKADRLRDRFKKKRRRARRAKRKAERCGGSEARRAGCARAERKAERAKRSARRADRRADRARGRRAQRLDRRADRKQRQAKRLLRKARNCERGAR